MKQYGLLLDSKVPTRRHTVYNIKTQGSELIIQAIHGFTIGAICELRESYEAYNQLECLWAAAVSQIDQFYCGASLLSHPKRQESPTLAVQVG